MAKKIIDPRINHIVEVTDSELWVKDRFLHKVLLLILLIEFVRFLIEVLR